MKTMVKKSTILETSCSNLEYTARRLNLKDFLLDFLIEPKERIEVTLNSRLPSGPMRHIRVYICRHNDALGPAKGGIRMTGDVTLDDIIGLSMEMTWKTALIGVPFGGGKSGIRMDPSDLNPEDKETIIRSFTRNACRHIGPEVYIPAPDMGTNQEDMGHIRDCISYSQGTSITTGCHVTGKPVILGGIMGRKEATGRGVIFSVIAACKSLGINVKGAKVAVQGFGNVGSIAAMDAAAAGAKIIAVSDLNGGIMNENGLDVAEMTKYFEATGSISGFDNACKISNDELLGCDCDILIPAATQSQITVNNASKIRAKIIAEGANSPATPEADDILNERGIFIIPDILCNAGGVFVSYLEYTQETQREQMTFDQVQARLEKRMYDRFYEVFSYHKEKQTTMRNAAMDIAVQRVVNAINARGLLP
jgi:glutamate dehydrogenase/leucine dehydrogenase